MMDHLPEIAEILASIVALPYIIKYFFITLMWAWNIDWR